MGQASPFVTAKHLNSHIQKTVVVAGKVATLNDNILTLNGGDAGSITVARNRPFQVMIELGMNLMVRGVVNPDLSIAESATFPPTDLGEKFGMFYALKLLQGCELF